MSSRQVFRLRKTFFVSLSDEEAEEQMDDQRKQLTKQIFQLAYFGHVSPEYASSLEINERNYLYQLLADQLESEKKAQEAEASKVKSKIPHVPKTSARRR